MYVDPNEAPHDFKLAAVDPGADYTDEGISITLVDVREGRMRLHLTVSTGELLCERIATALERRFST